jgi:hypothetical protein
VPEDRRGYYTGWLQTSPTLGIVLSLRHNKPAGRERLTIAFHQA